VATGQGNRAVGSIKRDYASHVIVLGLAIPVVSFLLSLVFGSEWPAPSLTSVAGLMVASFIHAAYFVPVYLVITSIPRSKRDHVVHTATWGFLGLMMAVAPLQPTLRFGLEGLRFEPTRIVLEVLAFILIGRFQARALLRRANESSASAPTPDAV